MKRVLFYNIFLFALFGLQAQTQLLPELQFTNPVETASNASLNLDSGFGAGLHIDKLNIWGPLGIGAYAAMVFIIILQIEF